MLNIRFDQLKERISELKNESFKIIHSEEQKEKRKQKSEERLRDLLNKRRGDAKNKKRRKMEIIKFKIEWREGFDKMLSEIQ